MPVVKLSELVDALEFQSDTASHYLNKKTGAIVLVTEEDISAAEDDELAEDAPDWQKETIVLAKEVLETDNYLELPSQFDVDEYRMMEKFCLSLKDMKVCEDLYESIKGHGAFRRFKAKLQEYELDQDWFKYKDAAYREFAKDWCEANKIEYFE